MYAFDYDHPYVRTNIPGPKSLKLIEEAKGYSTETEFISNYNDLKRSKGNFLKDADNNTILDLSMSGNSLPLGYNHDDLINKRRLSTYDMYLSNPGMNVSEFPGVEVADLVREAMYLNNPKGLSEVHFSATHSLAVEQAISAALLSHTPLSSGSRTQDLSNQAFHGSVLCFSHSSHSKTLACQSLDSSVGSLGVPTFDWAVAPTPVLKFPMVDHETANARTEEACFKEFKRLIKDRRAANPVQAIIVEPITFSGTHFASPTFYQQLREYAAKHDIPFIVDETRTGVGITGKYWAHEHWYLDNAPDFVVFGRAAQVAGFYCKPEFRPTQPHKFSSVGALDMVKLRNYKVIQHVIARDRLLTRVKDTSAFLKIELERVRKTHDYFSGVRGYGNFIGFDVHDDKARKL